MTTGIADHAATSSILNIGGILAELRALRAASQKTRYHGAVPPELPSREAVSEIIEGLVSILYPRHFGPPGLTPEKTDEFLERTLDRSLQTLQDQIRRELQLFALNGAPDGADQLVKASEITSAFAARLPKIRALLDTDIRAAFQGDPAAKSSRRDRVLLSRRSRCDTASSSA